MAKVNAQLVALNRGEVSKLALGRIDLEKLKLAADSQVNWEPRVLGPMSLRPGLEFVGEVKDDNTSTLLDFIYAPDDTALLELTPGLMRIWIDDTLLTRPAVSTAISDPSFAGGGSWSLADSTAGTTTSITGGVCTLVAEAEGSLARAKQSISVAPGDQATEHGLRFTVTNGPVTVRIGSSDGLADVMAQTDLDTGTHSLSFTPGHATIYLQIDSTDARAKTLSGVTFEAAGVVTLPTPWGAADLANVRWAQSRDILFVACYGFQQRMIQRRGTRPHARGWSIVLYRSNSGPFHAAPDADITLRPNALNGNGTITASRGFFTPGHVGALLRIFTPQQNNGRNIGAGGAFTNPTRISGIQGDRNLGVIISGTWAGTWSLQRSLIGPDSGFVTIDSGDGGWTISGGAPSYTGNVSRTYQDNYTTASHTIYDNVVAWYRLGFESGNYTSGVANMVAGTAQGGEWGICRITGYISPTVVNVEILEPFTGISDASDWQISDWCPAFGWPSSVALTEGRLWWFSGGNLPIAGSQSGNYYGYAQEDRYGNALGDAGAILEDFGEGASDSINFALPLTRLLVGRETSVASIRSSSFDEPLTPTNFSVKDCATHGAARLRALKVDKRGIFVQQSTRRVYELAFDAQAMDYNAHDLTRLNHEILLPGAVATAVARQPDTYAFIPRADGQCAVLLYDPDDEAVAWYRVQTLGVIESVAVLPSPDGIDDLVYFVVRRLVRGVTKRFIEKFAARRNCIGGSVNQLMDSHVVYQGAASATITLAHLPSTTVEIWADGAYAGSVDTDAAGLATLPGGATASNIAAGLGGAEISYSGDPAGSLTGLSAYEGLPCEVFADQQPSGHMRHLGAFAVSGGAVALPNGMTSSTIRAYFGFHAPFMSAKLAYGAMGGSALAMKKKADHLGLLLYDTHAQAITIGQRFDDMDGLPLTEDGGDVDEDTVWGEIDGPVIEIPGEWDSDARICILGRAPLPATIGGLVVGTKTHG